MGAVVSIPPETAEVVVVGLVVSADFWAFNEETDSNIINKKSNAFPKQFGIKFLLNNIR
jgi:hypothetical protein